jgi:hypothetical protein
MDYLEDIKKIAMEHVTGKNAERCRTGLQKILQFIADEEMNYKLRKEYRGHTP